MSHAQSLLLMPSGDGDDDGEEWDSEVPPLLYMKSNVLINAANRLNR